MKFYHIVIRYRLQIALGLIALGVALNIWEGFGAAFIFYFVAVILIVGHFFLGPLSLVQHYMEKGDMDEALKVVGMIKFPDLLYKPIRSAYYSLQGQIAMMNKDFAGAEKMMKKGMDLGSLNKESEGISKFQLGMLAIQRNDLKEGETLLKEAIKSGLTDKDSLAIAYLQLSQMAVRKNNFRGAREYFRQGKEAGATQNEVLKQIKELEKYMSRLPNSPR